MRIDDLETGAVITSATDKAGDFFALYDIEAALADGSTLDTVSRNLDVLTDRGNAAGFDVLRLRRGKRVHPHRARRGHHGHCV